MRADRPALEEVWGTVAEPHPAPLAAGGGGLGEAVLPGPALAVWREVTAGGGPGRWPDSSRRPRRLLHKHQ